MSAPEPRRCPACKHHPRAHLPRPPILKPFTSSMFGHQCVADAPWLVRLLRWWGNDPLGNLCDCRYFDARWEES